MRRSALRPRPPIDHSTEAGYREWHAPIFGCCSACGERGPLERHHVVTERHVRLAGGDPYDLRNSLELGRYCLCHRDHTSAARRLKVSVLTSEHLAFMVELLGEDRACAYVVRMYRVG
jgi:hypothetical protein